MKRVVRSIKDYKVYQIRDDWFIAVMLQGATLAWSVGQEKPEIDGPVKLVLQYEEKQ